MTDSWTETIAKLNASGGLGEAAAAPVSGHHPEPVVSPAPWQPYGLPSDAPPEPAPAAVAPADPLILELEHPLAEPVPADHAAASAEQAAPDPIEAAPMLATAPPSAGEPPMSIYGRAEPSLAMEPEVTEPAPRPLAPPVPTPAAEAVVAQTPVAPPEKPVESEWEQAEPAPVAAVAPEPAPIVAAEPSPPASPVLIDPATPTPELVPVIHTSPSPAPTHDAIDPVLAGFDHVVALAGYVLLFISVFMFGVPALATMALAYAHKNDSHLLVRSHYRFQLRIFWTAILFALLAIGSAITAGGMAITTLVDFARAHLPGVGEAMDQAHVGAWSGQISGLLLVAAITLGILGVVWILVASLFGFLRLVGNRPIGHGYTAK